MTTRNSGSKRLAAPLALAVMFGATLVVIDASTEPVPLKLPALGAAVAASPVEPKRLSTAPSTRRRNVSATRSEDACNGAAWPRLPEDCVAAANSDRSVRLIR